MRNAIGVLAQVTLPGQVMLGVLVSLERTYSIILGQLGTYLGTKMSCWKCVVAMVLLH